MSNCQFCVVLYLHLFFFPLFYGRAVSRECYGQWCSLILVRPPSNRKYKNWKFPTYHHDKQTRKRARKRYELENMDWTLCRIVSHAINPGLINYFFLLPVFGLLLSFLSLLAFFGWAIGLHFVHQTKTHTNNRYGQNGRQFAGSCESLEYESENSDCFFFFFMFVFSLMVVVVGVAFEHSFMCNGVLCCVCWQSVAERQIIAKFSNSHPIIYYIHIHTSLAEFCGWSFALSLYICIYYDVKCMYYDDIFVWLTSISFL